MSHDKITAATRKRMAETGESYAAARREVIREHQAAGGEGPLSDTQWFAISYGRAAIYKLTAWMDTLAGGGPGKSGVEVGPDEIRVRMGNRGRGDSSSAHRSPIVLLQPPHGRGTPQRHGLGTAGAQPDGRGITAGQRLVSAIAINPNDPSVIYQGTAGGGIWRSIDGGQHWIPQFDRQAALGIGEPAALAIDPNDTDTIYIGTSQRVTPQPQAGLFKSTDGGNSCIRLGSGYPAGNVGNAIMFAGQWVNVIIVDPADSLTLYLASTRGVFRSQDGGLNWTQGTGISGDVRSLVLDVPTPAATRVLHAGRAGQGVFTSTDGGQTWTQVLSASTPAVAAALGAAPHGIGKVVVDIAPPTSPPNPAGVQVLYASMAGTGGAPDPVGFFVSTDGGATWSQQSATGMPGKTQGGYSFHFAVDPASPGDGVSDIIYFGTVNQARSGDSGQNFTGVSGLHADTHSWAFVPQPGGAPSTVYSGNDGGIFVSTDGTSFSPINSGGLQTGLFYNIDSKPDAGADVIVGALQDNEVETTSGVSPPGWKGTNGGDGWDATYDGGISGQLYCTSGFYLTPSLHPDVPVHRRRGQLVRGHAVEHRDRRRLLPRADRDRPRAAHGADAAAAAGAITREAAATSAANLITTTTASITTRTTRTGPTGRNTPNLAMARIGSETGAISATATTAAAARASAALSSGWSATRSRRRCAPARRCLSPSRSPRRANSSPAVN